MFDDREDAGRRLALALDVYEEREPLVLAIPKGGIPVGVEVARHLDAEFSVLITRKLPFPNNPESGFGAVAEDETLYLHEITAHFLSEEEIQAIAERQRQEIAHRIQLLRHGNPLPPVAGRTVILVDDGIAMGSTMRASVAMCRNQKAAHIVVAAPVASPRTLYDFERVADSVVILETPGGFRAVAEAYRHWHDVTDAEAVAMLEKHGRMP
jgi:putative phosphoribosyl transferase